MKKKAAGLAEESRPAGFAIRGSGRAGDVKDDATDRWGA